MTTGAYSALLAIGLFSSVSMAAPNTPPAHAINAAHQAASQYMTQLDLNKDGLVSKEEFVAPSLLNFQRMDLNRDGSVSLKEVTAHNEKMLKEMTEARKRVETGSTANK